MKRIPVEKAMGGLWQAVGKHETKMVTTVGLRSDDKARETDKMGEPLEVQWVGGVEV